MQQRVTVGSTAGGTKFCKFCKLCKKVKNHLKV